MSVMQFLASQRFHKLLVLVAVIPLSLTVFTAFFYRFSHSVFGRARDDVRFLISIHQGSWFGINSVLYTLCNGVLFILLAISGGLMLRQLKRINARIGNNQNKSYVPQTLLQLHRTQATFSVFILVWAAVTGAGYRFARNVLNVEKQNAKILMKLHHFDFFGDFGSICYCFICMVLISTAVTTGFILHPQLVSQCTKQKSSSQRIIAVSGSPK